MSGPNQPGPYPNPEHFVEKQWRAFKADPNWILAWHSWQEALLAGKEQQFFDRAWPFLRTCLRDGTPAPTDLGIEVTLAFLSLASGDLCLLEQWWERSSRDRWFWTAIDGILIHGGGSVITALGPLALDLGLDRVAPEDRKYLGITLHMFCSEVRHKWLGEWHSEWRRKFLIRHADKPEFTEAVAGCLMKRPW